MVKVISVHFNWSNLV